ncbi:MAG: TylF/MycF/NovP-related O-methyltransferase [Gammaproteobacteria bacterium]
MFYGLPVAKVEWFERALREIHQIYGGHIFASDMLITLSRNLSFWWDEGFARSFNSTAETDQEKSLAWRLHVLAWAAHHALHVSGDFVECGVLRGFSSAVICKYLQFETVPKRFFLYDTFAGLPPETSTEQERATWNYADLEPEQWFAQVKAAFAAYPNVEIVRGVVPEAFRIAVPERIAFLHIDMNSEAAELLALEHLFDRVSPGGLIVLDDFGWMSNRNQTVAEIDFMQRRGHHVLELPTGQGLVIKR